MGAKEVLAGLVHGVKVKYGIAALPGVCSNERVFLPMYEVGVFTAAGAEPGVEIIRHRSD